MRYINVFPQKVAEIGDFFRWNSSIPSSEEFATWIRFQIACPRLLNKTILNFRDDWHTPKAIEALNHSYLRRETREGSEA